MNAGAATRAAKPTMLLTGGAGFVGSHICNALAGQWRIKVFDNLSHGALSNVADHPDVSFHLGDLRSDADVRGAFDGGHIDAVVHCAAQTSVPLSMEDPGFDWQVNVAGTHRLVRLAAEHGAGRFIFMSSGGAVYGETPAAAAECSLPGPRSYYGLHKYAAEQVIRLQGISHAVLRPSNIYGPGQRSDADGGVVAIFLERLLAGLPLAIFGDGQQERDFVYVADVVEAVRRALDVNDDVLWNVCSGTVTSILGLLDILVELTGVRPDLSFEGPREGDVRRSLLQSPALAIQAPTSVRDGLRALVAASSPVTDQARPRLGVGSI